MIPFPGQRWAGAGRDVQLGWVLGEPSTYYTVMAIVEPQGKFKSRLTERSSPARDFF